MFRWPVVPICEKQMLDIEEKDLIPNKENPYFRICDIKKAGGGYDKFSDIWEKKVGYYPGTKQFVVQLQGCVLNCAYCYVTRDGIWNLPRYFSSLELLKYFNLSKAGIFHLMGGAPALYLEHWKDLAQYFTVFHSDFLLVEKLYQRNWVRDLPGLHAVSIKNPHDINVPYNYNLMFRNLDVLIDCGVNFYITFTGFVPVLLLNSIIKRYGKKILEDSFTIPIKNYKALE